MEQPYHILRREDGVHVIHMAGDPGEIIVRSDATFARILADAYARLAHVTDSLARLELAEEEAERLTARL